MTDAMSADNVMSMDKLPDLRTRLERLDAQRICLRITDRHWDKMKKQARKSPKPLDVALQSELDRCAHAIQQHYLSVIRGKA